MLSIVAAVARNSVIGLNNALPWRLPGDLRYFKELTYGKTLIMGRKTFESLPGLLPNRRHIVITRDAGYAAAHPGIETASGLDEGIANAPSGEEAFIIGGDSIYRAALPLCERLYITEVLADFDGDAFFPDFDRSRYELASRSEEFCENGVSYRFLCYRALDQTSRTAPNTSGPTFHAEHRPVQS